MSPFWIAVSIALSFAVGLLVGIILHKTASPGSTKRRRLEGQMDQMRDEYVRYQADVTQHFNKSAALIKRLNNDYDNVISHLAQGAEKLAGDTSFVTGALLDRHRSGKRDAQDDTDFSDTENLRERLRLPPDVAIEGYEGLGLEAAHRPVDLSPTPDRTSQRKKVPTPTGVAGVQPEPLQVPGTSASSIQGVSIARKHVKTADYDERHVDGYVEAPRDYAPRRGPDENGTLTEGYNLGRDEIEHDLRR